MLRTARKLLMPGLLLTVSVCAWSVSPPCRAAAEMLGGSTLLGSSNDIRQEFAAVKVRRVAKALSDLQVGSARATVSPEELRMMLGPEDPAVAGTADAQLTTVEVETRAPTGIREPPVQAQIPYGFGGIAWGVEHPLQAWRLLLPVLGSGAP